MSPWLKWTVQAILLTGLLFATATVVARLIEWQTGPLLYLVAATPYLTVVFLGLGLAAAAFRWWALTVWACVGLVAVIAMTLPTFLGPRAEQAVALTVMTTNAHFGEGDPAVIAGLAETWDADLLSVQELTGDEERALRTTGISALLPYDATAAAPRASGTGLWSAFPMSDVATVPDTWLNNVTATAATPVGPVTVVALHSGAPFTLDHEDADRDAGRLASHLAALPDPVVVAGDFNATRDNAFIRHLERMGFTDSATAAGSGLVRTWPTDRGALPPLFGLDHVMTRGFPPAIATHTADVPGSDHLALIVQLPAPVTPAPGSGGP